MKHTNRLALLLAFPALIAFTQPGQEPAFSPAAGSSVTKTYESTEEMTLDEMSVSMNGQEQDPSMMGMEQTIVTTMKIVVTDEYTAVADGRPTTLTRTFGEMATGMSMEMSHAMMGDMSMDMSGESPLEDLSVVFVWNEEDGDYRVKFAEDSDGDEELLEGLVEDTDLRGFLPGNEVSEGDTWSVEPEVLRGLLAFGGAMKMEFDSDDLQEMSMGMGGGSPPPPDAFLGELEGEVTAEFTGTREEDGATCAVIKVIAEISSAKDMTDFFVEQMEEAELPEGMEEMEMSYQSVDIEFEWEAEGILLWNMDAGRLQSIEMNGNGASTIDMAMSMAMMGQEMDMEMSMVMSGDGTTSITTGAGDE